MQNVLWRHPADLQAWRHVVGKRNHTDSVGTAFHNLHQLSPINVEQQFIKSQPLTGQVLIHQHADRILEPGYYFNLADFVLASWVHDVSLHLFSCDLSGSISKLVFSDFLKGCLSPCSVWSKTPKGGVWRILFCGANLTQCHLLEANHFLPLYEGDEDSYQAALCQPLDEKQRLHRGFVEELVATGENEEVQQALIEQFASQRKELGARHKLIRELFNQHHLIPEFVEADGDCGPHTINSLVPGTSEGAVGPQVIRQMVAEHWRKVSRQQTWQELFQFFEKSSTDADDYDPFLKLSLEMEMQPDLMSAEVGHAWETAGFP